MADTSFYKEEKRKITYSMGGYETECDSVFVGKYRKYARDVIVTPWKLQHRLVVVDLNKKILKNIVRKELIIRRRMGKLNEN